MRNLFLLFLLSLATLCPATALDFPLCIQEHDQWCWAGTSQAILQYYGLPITQTEIAQYGTEGANIWNWLYGESTDPTRRGIDLILDHFAGIQTTVAESPIPLTQVVTEIDSLQPFVTRIEWSSGGGHFIDCYGYDGNNLYLMNPWPGDGYQIEDYDYFLNGAPDFTWTHTLMLSSAPGLRAYFQADPNHGGRPLTVNFTSHPLGDPTQYAWDFENDGTIDSNDPNPTHTYDIIGQYSASLTVTRGSESRTYLVENGISVENNAPQVVHPIDDMVLEKNQSSAPIDLLQVFNDPDNDPLTFNFTSPGNHVSASIQNGIMIITPVLDWVGECSCVVQASDGSGYQPFDMFNVTVQDSIAVDTPPLANEVPLLQVGPNPVHTNARLVYSCDSGSPVAIRIHNLRGQQVREWKVAGGSRGIITWNGDDARGIPVANGVYLITATTAKNTLTRKVLLLKK